MSSLQLGRRWPTGPSRKPLKTDDADENAPKKNKATRASSKHDFMAPPILTVNYKGHAFRVLYEGLGGNTLWVEAKEETLRLLKNL